MTTHCREALTYGISLSGKYGASLYLMHVVHNPFGLEGLKLPPFEQDYSLLLKKSKEDLDAVINAERRKFRISIFVTFAILSHRSSS
jgi:hypothetical protein